jgi:hypothetical protein
MFSFHSSAQSKCSGLLCLTFSCALLGGGVLLASSDWQKADPSQWTDRDVYQILNKSPWSKTSKIRVSSQDSGGYGGQTPGTNNPGGTWGSGGQMPTGMGGMGRRGMGGGGYGGAGRGTSGAPPNTKNSEPSEVTVQWQSALPVRLAAAKKSGGSVGVTSYKPLDEYVLAVIGLPMRYIGGHSASADSAETNSSDDVRRLQDHLKSATSLLRSGHDPLVPTKVELNQGVDGRILFYFPKTDPITAKDKTVDFRIDMGSMDLKNKFVVKDMEYQEKLDL